MRLIKFKNSKDQQFSNWVDIGSCPCEIYAYKLFRPAISGENDTSNDVSDYEKWFKEYLMEPLGSQMLVLRFLVSEYFGWSFSENSPQIDYFKSSYGNRIELVVTQNLTWFSDFIGRWFVEKSSIFKGLDLNWDDFEDTIVCTEESKSTNEIIYEFYDGSMVITENDKPIKSFYVRQDDYEKLREEMDKIIIEFKPL
jgi:hypothetical protein